MGINGFLQFVKKKRPQLLHTEHISLFTNQRVFIDISGYIYRYICVYGKENNRWLNAMLNFFLIFKKNKVIPIPVFDGKPPAEKGHEIQDRKEKRERATVRINNLNQAITNYEQNSATEADEKILETEMQAVERRSGSRQLLSKKKYSSADIKLLKEQLATLKRQLISITSDDNVALKKLLTAAGVTWVQSPQESETYCCWCVSQNLGSAVISGDSDVLAQGGKQLILKVENDGMIQYIDREELFYEFDITQDLMIDWAILMGCDYNKHMENKNKIGPVKGLELLKIYKRIEDIPGIDLECLLVDSCRKMFNPTFDVPDLTVQKIDFQNFKSVLKELSLNENWVDKYRDSSHVQTSILQFFKREENKVFSSSDVEDQIERELDEIIDE